MIRDFPFRYLHNHERYANDLANLWENPFRLEQEVLPTIRQQ